MAQTVKRRNAEYIKSGDSSTGPESTRDKRVEDMGAQAKQHAAVMHMLNRTNPDVKNKPNKPVSSKVSSAQAAQSMSGSSYSKLLKVK